MKTLIKVILHKLGFLATALMFLDMIKTRQLSVLLRNPGNFWNRFSPDGLPAPPLRLIYYVAGTIDVDWFFECGKRGADSLTFILEKNGIALDEDQNLLDFGCGCGRVTRYWKPLLKTKVFGCDYNPKLIAWCQTHLPFGQFDRNHLEPPLKYDDKQFGLIYAFSVFTHLPAALQHAWIQELSRIIRNGGHLVITTHGRHYLALLSPDEREQFEADQLVIKNDFASGTNFCAAYHPTQYVRNKLAAGFEVVDYIANGAKGNPHQDIYLLRKLG